MKRATSSATFPCPMTTAVSPDCRSGFKSSYSGSPLYQPTKARADTTPFRSSPGMSNRLSFDAPYENRRAS